MRESGVETREAFQEIKGEAGACARSEFSKSPHSPYGGRASKQEPETRETLRAESACS